MNNCEQHSGGNGEEAALLDQIDSTLRFIG